MDKKYESVEAITNQNPLKGLADIYNEQVEEADQDGFAETYKTCANLFFKGLNEILTEYRYKTVTACDKEYMDGYYIFGRGTNSIINFHINECPGWLFGIWWHKPDDKKRVCGEFFAQYENTIDKFKPSYSEICTEVQVFFDVSEPITEPYCMCETAGKLVNFIRTEPYLAFCRDYYYWDYNVEHHTRWEAYKKYKSYCKQAKIETKYQKICDNKMLKYVEKRILPCLNNAEVLDRGDGWHPRYTMIAPYADNTDAFDEPGYYCLSGKSEKAFSKVESKCERIIKRKDTYWFNPVERDLLVYKERPDWDGDVDDE